MCVLYKEHLSLSDNFSLSTAHSDLNISIKVDYVQTSWSIEGGVSLNIIPICQRCMQSSIIMIDSSQEYLLIHFYF